MSGSTYDLAILLAAGAIAGFLAGMITRGRGLGIICNIITGVIGAFVGNWLFGMLGISIGTGMISLIGTALIGAVALLIVISLF